MIHNLNAAAFGADTFAALRNVAPPKAPPLRTFFARTFAARALTILRSRAAVLYAHKGTFAARTFR